LESDLSRAFLATEVTIVAALLTVFILVAARIANRSVGQSD
jgi:hypothetical protein